MELSVRRGQAPFRRKKLAAFLAQAAFVTVPAVSQAQQATATDNQSTALEVVKVTAERRETELQKTPVSVGVVSSADLEKTGFQHLFDIEKNVAGVSFFKGASNQQSSIFIRGVGTTNQGYTQAVGVYIDDVPLARSVAAGQWDLPDLERIEVLRGPQGTLYGQNSSAGAVRIISRKPTDEKVAWVSAGIGNYEAREYKGYVSGPLVEERLSGSVAFSYNERDGFGRNLSTGDHINGADTISGRAKLRFTPSDDWDAILTVDGLVDKSDNGTNTTPLNYGNTSPRDSWAIQDLTKSRLERSGVSLNVTKELNDTLSLRSITSYRTYEHDPDYMDIGGLPRYSNTWHQTIEQDLLFQEFQLLGEVNDALSYTAGVLFQNEKWANDNWSYRGNGGPITRQLARTRYDTDDIALYGQFDYRLSERWTITAGARYWKTEQTYDASAYTLDANLDPLSRTFAVSDFEKTSHGVTPRLTIGYQVTPEAYLYASYTEGAKFGGYNRSAANSQVASVAADPEEVKAYEIGLKTNSFDNRLQINAALFYNDYSDYLAVVSNPTINGTTYGGSVLMNAAKAETYGAELEVRAKITRGLDWNFSFAYVESEFKEFFDPYGNSPYEGNQLPFAPKYQAATGLSYTHGLSNGDEVSLYGSVQFTDRQFSDQVNNPRAAIPSRTTVDLGADYRFADGHWSAGIKVRNLTDKDHIILKSYIPAYGIESAAYDEPRTVVASVRYDF
ncbi:TonB-dependent receptor [Pseudomonas sp. LRF_L74]|uniref:TonB-dependent receptor n=1 Tax=Pseudomonas sp. LRF_L74 TaxID=3369422 RepID=UPI003F6056BC